MMLKARSPLARRIKDPAAENALFRRRALAGFAIIAACLAVLLGRFFYLQVLKHDEFSARSDANRIKIRALPPARGLIYDRSGVVLADNVPQYRLELTPEQIDDVPDTLARLREVVPLSDEDLERFAELSRLKRRFDGVPVRLQLSEAEVAHFAVHRHRFPGVDVVPYLTRSYPQRELLSHVVGYVGRIDEGDRERLDPARYAGFSHIGKTGIERQYESMLLGEPGYEHVETDAAGRALRVLHRVPPKQGQHVRLTIDAKLQAATIAAFEGRPGAAVAIDPRNGEVLALVSLPGFDPNLFVNGISRREYRALIEAPYRPLFNRALQGGYEPGSTIKPFLGLAGLELGLRTPEWSIMSTGQFRLEGASHVWHDWKRGGHGRINLREAIAQSVNVYFYQLAVDIGIDRMNTYLANFGFGAPTRIDLGNEASGLLPSREWKQRVHQTPWYPGETVIAGIGQGYFVTTPLQLASALATLAAGGERHAPHLKLAAQPADAAEPIHATTASFVRDPANLAAVREGMIAVMHSPTGTARAFGTDARYVIAGKSGTAQRYTRKEPGEYDETRIAEHLRHQALFVAYAPAEDPRIAVAIVVEHGSSGSKAAAPVARAVLDAYLLAEPASVAKGEAP